MANVSYGSPSVGADGTVYIGSDDCKLHAIAPNGSQRWEFTTGNYVESSPVIGSDGTIYISSLDRYTYALDPSGHKLWRAAGFSGSPALAANGTLYVAQGSGSPFCAFDHSGAIRWGLPLYSQGIVFSSPVIGPDGTIYITAGAWLFAIYGDSPPQQAPWAMFRREPTHAARAPQRALGKPTHFADGSFGITLGTETGLTYRVQASVDLANWSNLATFVATDFTTQFIDSTATNFSTRFYRLATP
jgi:hypothetical protein